MLRSLLVRTVVLLGLSPWICLLASCASTGDSVHGDTGDATGVHVTATTWKTYSRKVANPFAFPVNVLMNGNYQGWLNPGAYNFISLPEGEHAITLTDAYGRVVREFLLTAP